MVFERTITTGTKETVVVDAGRKLNILAVSFVKPAGKRKNDTTLIVTRAGSDNKEVIHAFASKDGSVKRDVMFCIPASWSPAVLSIDGPGAVTVSGELVADAASAPPTGKSKKRKSAPSTVDENGEPAAKIPKQELPKFFDLKKPWKVKPQNDEGVLVAKPKPVFKEKGLKCIDYVVGNGAYPKPGAPVKINYIGILGDGTVFDARIKRKQPLIFRKGVNQVVRGLDLGMEGMKIGGAREITIPPELG